MYVPHLVLAMNHDERGRERSEGNGAIQSMRWIRVRGNIKTEELTKGPPKAKASL